MQYRLSQAAFAKLATVLVTAAAAWSTHAHATPLFALKEANNCGACHNNGRSQRPVLERRCTLDCQGCHVDPAGGGPRNEWGYYYSQSDLNTLQFFKPLDPLQNESYFTTHYDGRLIRRFVGGQQRVFPMSSEISFRVKPFKKYLHLTYSGLFFGRIGDQSFRATRKDSRRFREKYAVMVESLPLNTYVRAYRGPPMYGLRRPNHSLWIRERIGLDQFASTEAIEVGGTPNVPFMRWSYMMGDPYALKEDRQKGTSFHGGFRGVTLGWHLNGSMWDTRSKKAKVSMQAVGGGLKPWNFLLYGERNWRRVEEIEDPPDRDTFQSTALRLHPSSRIDELTAAFAGLPGVIVGYVHEELHEKDRHGIRRSIFADFHPHPFFQFEIWRRFERGTRVLSDTIATAHIYYDF